jgi:hypothetical protein
VDTGFYFRGVNQSGRGVYHPPRSGAEVKEMVEIYLYSRSGPSGPLLGRTYALSLILKDQLPAEVLGSLPCKPVIFKKRVKKVIIEVS